MAQAASDRRSEVAHEPLPAHGAAKPLLTPTRLGQPFYAWIWLSYLAYPVWEITHTAMQPERAYLALLLLGLFAGVYVAYWRSVVPRRGRGSGAFSAFTLATAVALTLLLRSPTLMQLTVYAAPSLAWEERTPRFLLSLAVLGICSIAALMVVHAPGIAYLEWLLPFLTVAAAMRGLFRFFRMRRDLEEAREEIEALAAANERLRIGRDLHDLLGHTLSAIALRAELARAEVLETSPAAAQEMARVAELARQALRDTRAAVTGFRPLRLAEEWPRLQETLAQAGIDAEASFAAVALPVHVERTLALVLREAGTNVLRHSGAHRCVVWLREEPDALEFGVEDDGRGGPFLPGSGLKGIQERVEALGGELFLASPPRGLRLVVRLPVTGQPLGG